MRDIISNIQIAMANVNELNNQIHNNSEATPTKSNALQQ